MTLPNGLDPHADVAVEHVTARAVVHAPGDIVTGCGQPMWAMQHPFPAAGHMDAMACEWCPACFPRASVWAQLVELAYPSRFRTTDLQGRCGSGVINSARLAGHPLDERSR